MMDEQSRDKVFEITVRNISKCGIIAFALFWACVIVVYFQNHILSLLLGVLMISTIRIYKVSERTYIMEYGLIPMVKRILYGKENN